jgi:hypothetical protein
MRNKKILDSSSCKWPMDNDHVWLTEMKHMFWECICLGTGVMYADVGENEG